LGEEPDEEHKEGSSSIHGAEGLLLQVVLTVHVSSYFMLEKQYMLEMVKAREHVDKIEQRHDLFSGLLDAAQDDLDPKAALNEEELMGAWLLNVAPFGISVKMAFAIPGNMFIFLFAGYEVGPLSSCAVT